MFLILFTGETPVADNEKPASSATSALFEATMASPSMSEYFSTTLLRN